jgi:hypothetical protein
MTRRSASLGILAAAALFGAGLGTARLLGWGPAPGPRPSASALPPVAIPTAPSDGGLRLVMPGEEAADGGSGSGPRILFDPDKITLLPDASLRLDLPDAGL